MITPSRVRAMAVARVGTALLLLGSVPAVAREPEPERSVTNREPDIVDVAKTPMTDLNIGRSGIPALLAEAQERPYSLQGLQGCRQLAGAVKEFDRVLGPDLDLPQATRSRFSKGRIAQWAVGTFIPFRSLIREISGANRSDRELAAAIQAGIARRAFLKGVGAARGCRWPAAPADEGVVVRYKAIEAAEASHAPRIEPDKTVSDEPTAAPAPPRKSGSRSVIFTSSPVVQPTR